MFAQPTDFYNSSPSFLFSFSQKELLIKSMNIPFLEKLGYTAEELIEIKQFTAILTVGSKIFYQTHFAPLLKLHGKFNEIFLSFVTRSQTELPVLMNVVLDEANDLYHCGGIQIDQRNRFEKELLEAKKVAEKALLENESLIHYKAQLESNQHLLEMRLQELSQKNKEHQQINTIISHDLQEPLRKVCMYSDKLLDEDRSLTETTASYLTKINLAADKMRELIIHLQKFLSLNEAEFQVDDVNLNDAINKALIKNRIRRSDPPVHLHIDTLPTIKGDAALFINVFDELINNSMKFKDPLKPDLQISIQCDVINQNIFKELDERYQYEAFTRIIYSDNGIGFDNSLADEIFSIFRKAHIREGLGIGLSYVKKVIELQQGSITARGVKGEGAWFTLLFPTSLTIISH